MVPRLQTPQRRRRTSGLARSFMAESRGPEPHTFRCHRCSKPCRRACPVDSPRWRTAEALIPSAEAPTRFPIEAGGAPVHCPDGGVTAGLHRSASRRPSVFKAVPARLSGSSSRAARSASPQARPRVPRFSDIEFGHHDRTRTYILDLRRVVLIQLSYVVMDRRRRYSPPAPLLLELDVPVQIVAPGLVQKVRRKQTLGRHQVVLRRLERLP